jgi:hypothetical protein
LTNFIQFSYIIFFASKFFEGFRGINSRPVPTDHGKLGKKPGHRNEPTCNKNWDGKRNGWIVGKLANRISSKNPNSCGYGLDMEAFWPGDNYWIIADSKTLARSNITPYFL